MAQGAHANYVEFVTDGQQRGAITQSHHGAGVQLTSACGDFGEWHEKLDSAERLAEGSIVGFFNAKVTLCTHGAALLGVVSGEATEDIPQCGCSTHAPRAHRGPPRTARTDTQR